MTYSFSEQKIVGDEGEAVIMAHFSEDWLITKAHLAQQKKGIDFNFQHKERGISRTVELKTDSKAHRTGNAFVETYSSFPDKKGWAHTCQADYLFYYLPQDRLIYVFHPKTIRELLPKWAKYPTRSIPNYSWVTRGLLVPLAEFEKHSQQVITL